jgi:cell surface protein SprA
MPLLAVVFASPPVVRTSRRPEVLDADTAKSGGSKDSLKLRYPIYDNPYDPTDSDVQPGLLLGNPSNIKNSVDYDADRNIFNFNSEMGNIDYRHPSYMTFEEYMQYDLKKNIQSYWKQRHEAEKVNSTKALIPKINVNNQTFDRIFGGNTVDIRPSGTAELIFGVNTNRTENPALAENQRKVSNFDFQQRIQLNLIGKIGDKLKITTNYNTESTFDFENQMKIEYTGYEDEILKKVEAGNVNLPLNGTLITGSQSLFGLKTQMQFGRTTVTNVYSQQRGKKQEVNVQGGAQITRFEVNGDNYEANRHYFLSQFFRDRYDQALSTLPVIQSEINITRIEVYVTNMTGAVENTRNVVAFYDLGESRRTNDPANPANANQTWYADAFVDPPISTPSGAYPDNRGSNNLYDKITGEARFTGLRNIFQAQNLLATFNTPPVPILAPVQDYEILENARKLQPTEFSFNPRLGYISINQALNNQEVVAVAFQYTVGDRTYQVGEFSTDGMAAPNALYLKLIKPSNVRVRLPIWDLMMKNVYSIGGYNLDPKDFKIDVLHANLQKGVDLNYIPEGSINKKVLVQVLGFDRINNQQERIADGVFDFVDGITINKSNGRIYFPVVEPFGGYLRSQFKPEEQNLANKYVFQELYDSTKTAAQQIPSKNRFKIRGQYSSAAGGDISLNATNVPQGSVTVTAGGTVLKENIDYTVDYTLGRVKIINEGVLASGQPIKCSLESQSLFNIQTRRLFGMHVDHKFSKDFTVGGTLLNLTERPLTFKVNMGDEPISNTIWGMDANYRTEVPLLTKLVDKIPFIDTKEKSTITVSGEFANLIPGHSRAIGKEGVSYIDDFEGSQALMDIKAQQTWTISSVPQGQPDLFPEAYFTNDIRAGYNRSKIAWYVIDPLFFRQNNLTPDHIRDDKVMRSNHFMREVLETEIFPQRQLPNGQPGNLPVLDIAYYPSERGPYNYDVIPNKYSSGLLPDGRLNAPSTRWGGIMRRIETTDFETANIEYIQFWLMDPFNEDNPDPNTSGELYINIGDISEDILKDGRKAFENGLPTTDTPGDPNVLDSTAWGVVPNIQQLVNAFDNNPASRPFQDVGLDGLTNTNEISFFSPYLNRIDSALGAGSAAKAQAVADPSADDFAYFRDPEFDNQQLDILKRYKNYGGLEGNSSVEQPNNYPISSTVMPNVEDINRDNNLTYNESYFQYKVKIDPNNMVVGQNNITDVINATAQTPNGARQVKWYQFKIPLRTPQRVVGDIQDFRSIRFLRMFLKGFDKPVIMRFGRLDLVRGDWRKYNFDLRYPGEYIQEDNASQTAFNVLAVNLEENGNRQPINYVLPPGIFRQVDQATTNLRQLNEQSLSLRVCNLQDGFGRAAYKVTNFDVRQYKRVRMFVHLEAGPTEENLKDNDLKFFIRLGTDYDLNYYEYEIPLKVSPDLNQDPAVIWPSSNELDLAFSVLQDAKLERNVNRGDLSVPYEKFDDSDISKKTNKITVMGNPNLAAIKVIMVGIRNPKRSSRDDADDGLPKCAEMWINELRLTDFDEKGGWAATARIQAKLADFADVTGAVNWRTQGFGSIEQRILERSRDNVFAYDLASTVRLDKFFPQDLNLSIPMYVGFSQQRINPQWNPLDPDITLKQYYDGFDGDKARKDTLRNMTQDFTQRRSINFTNVKKEKGKNSKKNHVYDIENFAVSYAYTEVVQRNFMTELNNTYQYKGSLAYNYNNNPKGIKPFAKVKGMKSEYFKLITDFNFNPAPSRLSFRTDLDRNYNVNRARNTTNADLLIQENYNKAFLMNRNYDLKWDLAKSLTFDFSATNTGRVDEIQGKRYKDFDPETESDTIAAIKDSLNTNLRNFGRTTAYHHTGSLNWNIPINKFPLFNWLTATAKYTGNYDWTASPPIADSLYLGNTISNSNQKQLNANINMVTLYNKIPYFKKVLSPKKPEKDTKGKATPKDPKKDPKKDANEKAAKDSTKKKEVDNGFLRTLARLAMTIRTGSLSYTETNGTSLPGYLPRTKILGMEDVGVGAFAAPGPEFIAGFQDPNFIMKADENGWISDNSRLNNPFSLSNSKNLNARINLEPFKDLKVELNGNRTITESSTGIYRYDDSLGRKIIQSPLESGNFSISVNTWKSAFVKDRDDYSNEVFERFLESRKEISARLGQQDGSLSEGLEDTSGYYDGYGRTAQDVMIPAFLAAYTGTSNNEVNLNAFPKIPKPNWRITYDGLTKLEFFKKYFKTFTISHAYRSSFNVGSFTTNQYYRDNGSGFTEERDILENFRSRREIAVVSISEQMAPLGMIDMTWNNSLLTKLELKRDRNLSLSMANSQITEIRTREVVVGVGYRFKEVPPPFAKRFKWKIKSDLNLRSDVSFRRNQTIIRKIVEGVNQPTAGQTVISIKISADYILNERLNLRLFYDRIITTPLISTTFPTSNTNAGISLRFTIAP